MKKVYNLTVNNFDTYFVGVSGVLGHNEWCYSVDDFFENPKSIWNKTEEDITNMFDGYTVTRRLSTRTSSSLDVVILSIKNHPKITQVQIHLGGGRHVGAYYKFSTNNGKIKVVDRDTYKADINERTIIYYK